MFERLSKSDHRSLEKRKKKLVSKIFAQNNNDLKSEIEENDQTKTDTSPINENPPEANRKFKIIEGSNKNNSTQNHGLNNLIGETKMNLESNIITIGSKLKENALRASQMVSSDNSVIKFLQ